MNPTCVCNFFTFFERILYKSNCIIFIFSWCATHTKIKSKLDVIVTAGSQKITLWGRQTTPLGILRVNYTVFRVECLSYNEKFWKLCETKWRYSVTEVNGQKQETPQSRCFASGPRFERSTLKITIRSFVDGTNFLDVMPCSLVDMEYGLKVQEYL